MIERAETQGPGLRADGGATEHVTRVIEASIDTTAPPDAVFPLLVHLSAHLEWGGRAYRGRGEYLLDLDAPSGPAQIGTTWTSRGKAHEGTYEDQSVVTASDPPQLFEFETDAAFRRGSTVTTYRLRHRYTIASTPNGSRVTHREEFLGPPRGGSWLSRLLLSPALAPIVDRMGRQLLGTGLLNLATMAEAPVEPPAER